MCARFEQKIRIAEVAKRFGLTDVPPLVNAPDIRPTDQATVITRNGEGKLIPWGLEVPWSKQPMINARSETLVEKITFRNILDNRCIIPASCYFEWRKDGISKLKNTITVDGQDCFSMAGLFDGNRFTIITCEPAASISHVHNRMPVILAPDVEQSWLNAEIEFADVRKFLGPFGTSPMIAKEQSPPESRQKDLFA
jgi:putative SOS response-associated peptidase YedK